MLNTQIIVLCAALTLAACTSATPPVSQARPVVQPQIAEALQVRRFTLRGDANFEADSAALTAPAALELDRLVESTRHTALDAISISGYTDASGSDAHNQDLSERRALAVGQYLAAHGLKARRSVQVHGYGKANPVAPNTTAEGRAQNRRVEIVLDERKVQSQ